MVGSAQAFLDRFMYQVSLRFVTPTEKRSEVLDVLRGMIGPTEVARNCRGCRVYCDADDEDVVTYWALWEERADMDAHFRSDRFRALLPYIELSTEPPVVELSRLETLGGMECFVDAINAPNAPNRSRDES